MGTPDSSGRQSYGEEVPTLTATGVTVNFGGLTALSEVDIAVSNGRITGLVGPNGAGKTTLFSVLSGLLRPNSGHVFLSGEDITKTTPQVRARRGLARTFQQPELFMGLTVREHLVLAHRVRYSRARIWKDVFTGACIRSVDKTETERVDQLLALLQLTPFADQQAHSLPLGTSRLLEVARALATAPTVILLDEPFAGLDTHEAERLASELRQTVDKEEVSLVLVEHDVGMVLSLCSYIYVLDFGSMIAQGLPEQIRKDPAVRSAYLGDVSPI
jgi:ABC-type branched-subunit amino acid transport system ATPase component